MSRADSLFWLAATASTLVGSVERNLLQTFGNVLGFAEKKMVTS